MEQKQIWFTSDLHLCHNKIASKRGFTSIDEMNETIMLNWTKSINENDEVYILGDLLSGDVKRALELYRLLPGKKHVILGNHDTERRVKQYIKSNVFESVQYAHVIYTERYAFYLSHYPTKCTCFQNGRYFVSLCGHEHTDDKFLDWSNQHFVYHCEVDAHNYHPVSLTTIISDIDKQRYGDNAHKYIDGGKNYANKTI